MTLCRDTLLMVQVLIEPPFCRYDWRFPDYNLDGYFTKLKALVEKAYSMNEDRTVSLISQSNGTSLLTVL
jgi:hypothetical protein